ncbi:MULTISPECIES: phage late control D family protein [Agrobacterium tumefaciens complex]|uniref:Putative Phage late control D n=1 Tax=Agrobacterium tomkonis CFBP 6623 TaxID=1183432 RepID=A0A1S7NN84_9HYPH|nr:MULTISPECIES: contractile injection system protein, VgrG/Pvc8 family [Agrobacterium tumefaciens complex]QCL89599.1 phage late control D family protein [Agrobacterium tumefaciens]CUX09451.1 putative Phage late control D [Agrobacterium tomkonis CFBP 6623]
MKPRVEVSIDGVPVAGHFYERLLSLTVTDEEGMKSDTVDIELNDGPPNFLAIPRKGAIISVKMGFGDDLVLKGVFTADKVNVDCLPYKMSISGRAADLRSGKLKERQERSWDKTKLGDILSQIANESGLSPAVDEDLADFQYEWLAQQDESNINFLRRLAERHNGLFAVKQKRLIFTRLGSGLSASGAPLGSIILTPEKIKVGSLKVEINDRTKYSKVVAYYQDSDKAERVEIDADADADGDSVYRLPEPYASPAEADKAARAKAKELQRGEGSVSVTVIGDAGIDAGLPLLFANVRPGVDGVPYIIKTAKTAYMKTGGLEVAVSGRLYDGKSATEKSAGTENGGANATSDASKATGKVAPNSAPGTPATPSSFLTPRRFGRTDEN